MHVRGAETASPPRAEVRAVRLATYALLVLLCVLLPHVLGVLLDYAYGTTSPLELDYGEGIVWQQAVLIPGPRMYAASQDLPFIVFHYPPVYYLLTHLAGAFAPNLLVAGRCVSVCATLLTGVLAGTLVYLSAGGARWTRLGIAASVGCLVPCLHAVHLWGGLMRVDATAIAFSLAGLAVGLARPGRFANILAGLLLCTVAVFTKQTQMSAGVALCLVSLCLNARATLAAAAVTVTLAVAAAAWLQMVTAGGFLQNVVGYNINRFSLRTAYGIFRDERTSAPVMLLILPAGLVVAADLRRTWRQASGWRPFVRDAGAVRRAGLLAYVLLTGGTLLAVFKSGGNFNYLIEWLCAGCIMVGVALCRLTLDAREAAWRPAVMLAVLTASVAWLPLRQTLGLYDAAKLQHYAALIDRIAQASKPVSSENMTLLIQAGKQVVYEPAIVTELAELGRWDESSLVAMIRAQAFAFMLTADDTPSLLTRRTAGVDAAMREAYPCDVRLDTALWVHLAADTQDCEKEGRFWRGRKQGLLF